MFIFMQKIRFIPQLFFEILVRYCKLYILGTWDMPGHAYKKEQYQLLGNFDVYLHVKKIHLIPHFFLMVLHFKESCNLTG